MTEIVTNKNGIEFDIDAIATDLNGKMDRDGVNSINPVMSAPYVTETYHSGTNWYRVWSDGWCEQGGVYSKNNSGQSTITLHRNYVDTNYQVFLTPQYSANVQNMTCLYSKATDQFIIVGNNNSNGYKEQWEAKGYIR